MKDKAMKFVLGAVLVAVSMTAAAANPTIIGGCEVERIKGSNAYFRTDANCVFGKAPASSGVRYSTKAGAVPSVSPRIESDQPNLWVRLGNLLTKEGTGRGQPAIDRSVSASDPEAPVSGLDDSTPDADRPLAGGGSAADDAAGNADNNAGDPETESTGLAGASDATSQDDGDNGHGNDVGGVDASNPGQGAGAGASGEAGTQDGAGGSSGADNANDQGGGQASATDDGNNGHGNDEGGVDPSNPGKGGGVGPSGGDGTSNGQSNGGGSGNGANNQGGGQSADAGSGNDGDNGHGNDAGGVDPSNPGRGRPKG